MGKKPRVPVGKAVQIGQIWGRGLGSGYNPGVQKREA